MTTTPNRGKPTSTTVRYWLDGVPVSGAGRAFIHGCRSGTGGASGGMAASARLEPRGGQVTEAFASVKLSVGRRTVGGGVSGEAQVGT